MNGLTDYQLEEATKGYSKVAGERFNACKLATNSHIEAWMLWAIWCACDREGESFGLSLEREMPADLGGTSVLVIPQLDIGNYKADFAIAYNQGSRIIVECDGHDFHEKTKQQAQHDKQRDRFVQDKGWKIYRFTGSEIYKSPLTCANGVIESLRRASYE
ncbi:endonuclease domain-containing protein [Paenochrobactrum glaciei]|uniref:Restriction endonuclease type II-like domain-containing protein n=1 Tax=Paenochrobactrum glaciei TaxID=486407 RepID=A0ABN1GQX4_9HYPH